MSARLFFACMLAACGRIDYEPIRSADGGSVADGGMVADADAGSADGGTSPGCAALWGSVRSLSTALVHSCAVTGDGALYCWGGNDPGVLGTGDTAMQPRPVPIGAMTWRAVSCGERFTIGLADDGTLHTWGDDYLQQLGNGAADESLVPAPIGGSDRFDSISAGGDHGCAIRTDGALLCWGSGSEGQLGLGDFADGDVPRAVTGEIARPWIAVSCGLTHTCAIHDDGSLECFGSNVSGELGAPAGASRATAARVGSANDWSAVAASENFTCGIHGGALACWGANNRSQLGIAGSDRDAPTDLALAGPVAALSTGGDHGCALVGQTLSCWGVNDFGELITGDLSERQTPEAVATGILAVASGVNRTCAVTAAGVLCAGDNRYGGVGNGGSVPEVMMLSAACP